MIKSVAILEAAREINVKAAIEIPKDVRQVIKDMKAKETHKLSQYVLTKILENYDAAVQDQRPMCADTGLPRYYAKIGNDTSIRIQITVQSKTRRIWNYGDITVQPKGTL